MSDLIRQIASEDREQRRKAAKDLEELSKSALTTAEVKQLLEAATAELPRAKLRFDDPSAVLVRAAGRSRDPEFGQFVLKNFSGYSRPAQEEAIYSLLADEDRRASATFMSLLRQYAREPDFPRIYRGRLGQKPRDWDVFFPELLTYLDVPQLRPFVLEIALAFASNRLLEPAVLQPFGSSLLTRYLELRDQLTAWQSRQGRDWIWADEYQVLRSEAEVLLDLLGYVPGEEVRVELGRATEELNDPRLKCFAVVSLVRQGGEARADAIEDVARSAEMRNILFTMLRGLGKASLYPAAWLNQAAFAEADMVHWLTFPTELGRAPDEIELMKVVSRDDRWDYFVFRFRTTPPHWAAKRGWLAGVSGPYDRKLEPTPEALGGTFSRFEAWNSRSPEQHVGDAEKLIEELRRRSESSS